MNNEKLGQYVLFLFLFITAQSLSMWGQYVTLPFKKWAGAPYVCAFPWQLGLPVRTANRQ